MFGETLQDKHLADLRGFTGLTELNLTRSPVTDAGMFYVGKLTELQSLMVGGTVLTDEGFEQLQNLTKLKSLNLIRTGITDDGLQHFSQNTDMDALWLECTDITDRGLKMLVSFPKLGLLDVSNTLVSDAGLADIGQLTKLEELSLSACEQIFGAGFSHVANLRQLKELYADNCTVGDDILSHLTQLPLQTLSLNWTDITDAGLQAIGSLMNLSELHLIGSRVSNAAAAEFQAANPDCNVHHSASRA